MPTPVYVYDVCTRVHGVHIGGVCVGGVRIYWVSQGVKGVEYVGCMTLCKSTNTLITIMRTNRNFYDKLHDSPYVHDAWACEEI